MNKGGENVNQKSWKWKSLLECSSNATQTWTNGASFSIFSTLAINSPCCILNSSYSYIKTCFHALFTSFISSCVTSSTSHMSLALLHWEILNNSSIFNEDVRMFFTVQSYWARLLSSIVHSFQGLSTYVLSTCLGV